MFSEQSLNKNLLTVLFQRNYLKSVVRVENGPRDGQSFLAGWGKEWGLVEWAVSKNICHGKLRNFEIFAVINKKS